MGYYINKNSGLTDAQEQVLAVLAELGSASPGQIAEHPGIKIGRVMLQRHLKKLLNSGEVIRVGSPPRVYYEVRGGRADRSPVVELVYGQKLDLEFREVLESFFAFSDATTLLRGELAFKKWFVFKQIPVLEKQKSGKKSFDLQVKDNFVKLLTAYIDLRRGTECSRNAIGLFDATSRYRSIHSDAKIEKVFYLDFYSFPQFGKTLLGYLIQKAKVGEAQSLPFVEEVYEVIDPYLQSLVADCDALLWVPHSLRRRVSLLDILQKKFISNKPTIKVVKVFVNEVVPQESISDLSLRLENAMLTNHIQDKQNLLKGYRKVCIIDGAIGSTIHAIATKLKSIVPTMQIIAFAPVGSYKGFEVIADV